MRNRIESSLPYLLSGFLTLIVFFSSFSYIAQSSHSTKAINYRVIKLKPTSSAWSKHVLDFVIKPDGNLSVLFPEMVCEYDGQTILRETKCSKHVKKIHWDSQKNELIGYSRYGIAEALDNVNLRFKEDSLYYLSSDGTIFCLDEKGNLSSSFRGTKKKIGNIGNIKVRKFRVFHDYLLIVQWDYSLHLLNYKTKERKFIGETGQFLDSDPDETKLIIRSDDGVFELNSQGKLTHLFPESIQFIRGVAFLDNHNYWVALDNGIIVKKKDKVTLYKHEQISDITCIGYYERENCLFIGTRYKGLFLIELESLSTVPHSTDSYQSVSGLVRTASGEIYAANHDQNVMQYIKGQFYSFPNSTPIRTASILYFDKNIHLGSYGYRIQKKNGTQFNSISNLPDTAIVLHVLKSTKQNLYLVGTSFGLYKGKNLSTLSIPYPKKFKGRVVNITERKDGSFCFGLDEKIIFLNSDLTIRKTYSNPLIKEVRAFYEDPDGRLWIGTLGNGLYCFHHDELTHINSMPNCKLDENIHTLALDNGNIIMTSNNGLHVVSFEKLRSFYQKEIPYLIPFILKGNHTVTSNEYNGMTPNSFVHLRDGNLFFSSVGGVIKYYHDIIPKSRKITPRIIKTIINGGPLENNNYQATSSSNNISIHLSKNTFVEGYNTYFQYRIANDPNRNDWSSLQKSTRIEFDQVAPGKHKIEVRCIDGLNVTNPLILSKEIIIYLPWYKSLQVQLSFIACIILLIVIYRFWKYYSSKKMKKLELEVAHAKLSPHFLFNTLNGFHSLVNSKQSNEVKTMIPHLSRLLRKLIENEGNKSSTIQEEVELIKDYLKIEKMRLGERLTVSFTITEVTLEKQVPFGLLLPFVENAIVHGVNKTDVPTEVSISSTYIVQNKATQITIIDTGPGLSNKRSSRHKSVGFSIINSVIKFWKKQHDVKIQYSVNNSNSKGVIVIITIPDITIS